MNILIIGSKGFIGSHLLYDLRIQGHMVYGCDLIADYSDPHYFHFDEDGMDFEQIFRSNQFDVCLNCSGSASVPYSFEFPQSDFHLNATNVFVILDVIRRFQRSCRFVHFSSAAVYGQPKNFPITEESELNPISVYGYNKLISEVICKEFNQIYKVPVAIVRIFSAYGDGLKKQLFWDLYQKSKAGSVIELFGTGKETRDFIHVSDIVSAVSLVIAKDDFRCSIYNVASGSKLSIETVSKVFLEAFDPSKEIKFLGQVREGDPAEWEVDISKLHSLGFSPGVSIENGLNLYAEWVKNQ